MSELRLADNFIDITNLRPWGLGDYGHLQIVYVDGTTQTVAPGDPLRMRAGMSHAFLTINHA